MRVLFVDDDQKLLRGLRRMLSSKCCAWDMDFASSGCDALDMMSKQEFDIIVADMRMPGMDGAELLGVVQQRHPGTVRIVLSGHSERDYIMKAVRPAHQFLSKPCSEDELIDVIERAFRLRSIFTDAQIRDTVTRLDTLPALPEICNQLQAELDKEDSSLAGIGEIVARDVGLAANILKLVNSSFFGLKRAVQTPAQAVTYLGIDVLRGLILFEGLFSPLDKSMLREMSFDQLWRHSLITARFAKAIARSEARERSLCDQAFVGALLHDVGKLVLAQSLSKEYGQALALSRQNNVPILEAEQEVLGVTHAHIGGYLLGLWGFAPEVVLSVVNHNTPSTEEDTPVILPYVHAANALEHELVKINDGYAPHPMNEQFLIAKGLSEKKELWRELCGEILENGEES